MTTRSFGAVALAALLVAPLTPLFGGDWPSFRGPGARGVADGEELPTTWDVASGQNIRWKLAVPGMSHASPVVAAGRMTIRRPVASERASTRAAYLRISSRGVRAGTTPISRVARSSRSAARGRRSVRW